MRFRSSVACAGLVLFAGIAWPLFERVEHVVNVPLAPTHETAPLTIVRLLPDRQLVDAPPERIHRAKFILADPGRVLRHHQVSLLVGTLGTNPDLQRAELTFEGTRCVYRTRPGAVFADNKTLDLVRADGCAPLDGVPNGRVQLVVVLRNRARPVLWTHVVLTTRIANDTVFVDPTPDPLGVEVFVPSGRLMDGGESSARPRRIDLLAYTWQVAPGSSWIWVVTILGVVAVSLGFIGLWRPAIPTTHGPGAFARGRAAFLLSAGLTSLYAVLTPPFQAPDEPHHFVAFTEVADRPELAAQADAWAALGHVTRIRFRSAEHFTPANIGKPNPVWDRHDAPDSSVRGGGVHWLWRAVAPLLRSLPAPRVLLAVRLTNVLCLALLVGCFVALAVRFGQVPSPHLLAFPILLVPTLPFFGMHVSNHAPLVGAYVLIAGGLALILVNRRGDHVSGLMVGAGWAAAIALSRSALPLAPLIASVAGARLLFGPQHHGMLSRWTFWTGLTLPVLLALSMTSANYVADNTVVGASVLPQVPQQLLQAITRSPWLLAFAIPILAASEWGIARLRASAGPRLRSAARMVTRRGAMGAAALVVASMIGSIFFQYPELARIDPLNRPTAIEYARDAVWAGLTTLRFGAPDYMTSVTFWGGFGWLETLASSWFVSLVSGATGLALVGLLLHVARTSGTRRAFLLGAAVAGFAAALAAYALSLSQLLPIDLVGRYLFGLYLSMVVLCWSGISWVPAGPSRERLQSWIASACVIACTGVHLYCLRLLLYRYF